MNRAKDIAGMRERMGKLFTAEGMERGLAMDSRPTDVFVSPFSKCGTTWLQQIVHSLRTGGDMDFDDISRVVPWIEASFDLGIDLDASQRAEPRAFKSHLGYDRIPKPGRYVVSLRDPKDQVVSSFRFIEGWIFEVGSISIDDYARANFLEDSGRRYFRHFESWWNVRDRPEVLLLFFEDMKEDLPGTVARVAELCEIPADADLLDRVVEYAGFDFMKRHGDRFDDLMMRERSERVAGIPPGSDSSKVRRGQVGSHRDELDPKLAAAIDDLWREELSGPTGHDSYAALRDSRPLD